MFFKKKKNIIEIKKGLLKEVKNRSVSPHSKMLFELSQT